MKDAQDSGDKDSMLSAARLNWRLWTIFQADLLGDDCVVPDPIRHNILALAKYIDKISLEFMGDPKPDVLSGLININREIAGGLFDAQSVTAENVGAGQQENMQQATSMQETTTETPEAPIQGLGDIEA